MVTLPSIALSLILGSCGPAAAPAVAHGEAPPRLIVLVVVDQLVPGQMERLDPWLTGGLRRFADGQVWRAASCAHGVTETAPGHATLGTGLHPRSHGIVGNRWMDRDTGARVGCVSDPDTRLVAGDGAEPQASGSSPARLLAKGLADHLRHAVPGAKTIGIGGKDRAAILATGQHPDLALWWDLGGRGFVSSTWYTDALPAWVADWNAGWPALLQGHVWEERLPAGIEAAGIAPDLRDGEASPKGRTFPYPAPEAPAVGLARWVFATPLLDEWVLEMARRAVIEEDLGGDEAVDYLFVGLSATDGAGHAYGPYSRETSDLLLRTDRALGRFFELLDERVGEGRWIAALSSDHGVLELPESLSARGYDARRVPVGELSREVDALREELVSLFGSDYLTAFGPGGLVFADERIAADGRDPDEIHDLAAGFLIDRVPWLARAFTRRELLAASEDPGASDDGLLAVMARGYHPERSADVDLVQKPWHSLSPAGTGHGSPWPYDREVPLAFLGPGFAPGVRYTPCLTVDVLPTLLEHAGLEVPAGLAGAPLE